MALLINGNGFSPVTAQEDADLYAGLVGNELTVLNVGQCMAATVIDSTTVRISDGEAISQGRRIHIEAGQYDDFTIPAGTQGVTSYYIIGYKLYTDGSGNEVAATFVQASTQSGTITEEQLRDGASEAYVSFYKVKVVGLTISTVTPLYGALYNGLSNKGIQKGVFTGTATDIPAGEYKDYGVYFPEAFESVPVVLVSTMIGDSGGTGTWNPLYASVVNVSPLFFTVRVYNPHGVGRTGKFSWIAIV